MQHTHPLPVTERAAQSAARCHRPSSSAQLAQDPVGVRVLQHRQRWGSQGGGEEAGNPQAERQRASAGLTPRSAGTAWLPRSESQGGAQPSEGRGRVPSPPRVLGPTRLGPADSEHGSASTNTRKREYNDRRPHLALRDMTPAEWLCELRISPTPLVCGDRLEYYTSLTITGGYDSVS